MNKIIIPLHTLLYSLASINVSADPHSPEIEQVVITGTRTEKSLADSPVPIEVISSSEIEMLSSGTVAETLDFMSGIVVKRSVKDGYNIFMQGFDSSRVKILVDGMPLITPTGESVDLDQISAMDIERIEVIRGAASVLYGSSAMGGVVNIISRNPQANSLLASYENGQFTESKEDNYDSPHILNLGGSLSNQGWFGQLSFQDMYNPGFDYAPETDARDAGEVEKNFFRTRVGGQVDDFKFYFSGQSFEESKYKITAPFVNGLKDFYRSDVEQDQYDVSLINGVDWQLKARHSSHKEESGQRTSPRKTAIENNNVDFQYVWGEEQALNWISGVHLYTESLNQEKLDGTKEVDNKNRDGTEAFVQADWQAKNNIEVVGGLRVQKDSNFSSHSAFRTNVKWYIPFSETFSLNWRSSIGEGYRVPNLKERFYVFDHSNLGYIIYGNEQLVPETSLSATSSVEIKKLMDSGSEFVFEISAHQSSVENLIESQINLEQSTPGLEVYDYQNLGKVDVSGADVGLKLIQTNQQTQLSYAYLDARDADTHSRLLNRPYHQIKFNYQRQFSWLDSRVLFFAVYELDEAHRPQQEVVSDDFLDINITYALQISKTISMRLGIENLLDEHRQAGINPDQYFDPRPVTTRYVFTQLKFNF